MKKAKEIKSTITKTYVFTDDEIEEILFNHLGRTKTYADTCYFDVGQCLNGATITIKRDCVEQEGAIIDFSLE